MPAVQSKSWVFTLNNYDDIELAELRGATTEAKGPSYICWGEETGDSGTPHLQGYVEFPTKRAIGGVKKIKGFKRCHLEIRKGTAAQAILYTTKDGRWSEAGERAGPTQGQRNDIEAVRDQLREGTSLSVIAMEQPLLYCRYRNGLRDIAAWCQRPRKGAPRVEWVWGDTGAGKSAYAHSICPGSTWTYGGDGWFDGYCGQEVAIFDDFGDDLAGRRRAISYKQWLNLTDRYQLSVPVKGGFVEWNPRVIIFTTNRDVSEVYSQAGGYVWGALKRRITKISKFTKDFPWVGLAALLAVQEELLGAADES